MFFQHRECFPGIHWKCCVTAFVNVISSKLSPKQAAGMDSFFRTHPSLAGCGQVEGRSMPRTVGASWSHWQFNVLLGRARAGAQEGAEEEVRGTGIISLGSLETHSMSWFSKIFVWR